MPMMKRRRCAAVLFFLMLGACSKVTFIDGTELPVDGATAQDAAMDGAFDATAMDSSALDGFVPDARQDAAAEGPACGRSADAERVLELFSTEEVARLVQGCFEEGFGRDPEGFERCFAERLAASPVSDGCAACVASGIRCAAFSCREFCPPRSDEERRNCRSCQDNCERQIRACVFGETTDP